MQGNGAVTTVYGGIGCCKRAADGSRGQLETVPVVGIPLTNGVVERLIVYRMDDEGQGTDGVTSPTGLQGVADDGVGSDG